MKRFLLLLVGALLLAGTLSNSIHVLADGNPNPQCPPQKICKP
jgi:hypothetical protein